MWGELGEVPGNVEIYYRAYDHLGNALADAVRVTLPINRYETPEVFESLTKEWAVAKTPRRTRRRTQKPASIQRVDTVS